MTVLHALADLSVCTWESRDAHAELTQSTDRCNVMDPTCDLSDT